MKKRRHYGMKAINKLCERNAPIQSAPLCSIKNKYIKCFEFGSVVDKVLLMRHLVVVRLAHRVVVTPGKSSLSPPTVTRTR